jgi:DNA-binding protein
MAEDNVVFVGNKPPMNYVLAVITQFHNGAKKVEIKARGKAISRVVDVAEIVKNKFMDDVKVSGIDIGTEEIQSERGGKLNVSTINITLEKDKSEKKK